ncbi:lysine-specific demethylase REF6-like [Daucus carota subsp. sativus]|uniref:lysine-specific demethylase REF6-like n=1 Tax=Daucus carota subsp. sativus TaxID=79200 RepID=UPI0030829C65
MSPEVIVNAGIPCYRLVQNPGEFVFTFPRAYHSGFSHGFTCLEVSNIATPEWLQFAGEDEIRRAAVNYPPLVSHIQLLYDLAPSFSSVWFTLHELQNVEKYHNEKSYAICRDGDTERDRAD